MGLARDMKKINVRQLIIYILLLTVAGCISPGSRSKKSSLKISFEVNKKEGIQPSYSTAIWLENQHGEIVKTLYVSEYLSLGGFNDLKSCPDWSKKSRWAMTPRAEADAVTGATPMIGNRNYDFAFSKGELPPGRYKYFIEVHLLEEFNELYSGEIDVPCNMIKSKTQVTYLPEKHPKAGDILSNITLECN